jgi:hypothetical protein
MSEFSIYGFFPQRNPRYQRLVAGDISVIFSGSEYIGSTGYPLPTIDA